MKYLNYLIIILILISGCSPKEVDISDLKFGESPLVADSIFIKDQQTTLVFYKGEKFSGRSIEKYGNGQIKSKLEFKNGLSDGTQEAFYLKGNQRFLCNCKSGHLIKEFKQYFENGNIKRTGRYNNDGLFEGIITVYFEDGNIHQSVSMKNGKLDGLFIENFPSGKVSRKMNYIQGVAEGDAEVFNEDGSSKGKFVVSNGIIKESSTGESISTENTSTKSTAIDDNNRKPNIEKIDYNDGHRYYIGEVKNGLQDGRGKVFVDNVLRYDGDWKNGNFNGIGKYYNEDGKLIYNGEFRNNKMEGRGTLYSIINSSKVTGEYRNGDFIPDDASSNSSSINYTINTNGQDIVKCSYCGKSFQMKDGYVQTSTNKTAYLGWTQLSKIETAKKAGYPQETVNQLSTYIKYGHWFCSKKCAYESGVRAVDE